jgi:hypothetical protein
MSRYYGVYLAYSKWEVFPDEVANDPNIPRYPSNIARVRCFDNSFDQLQCYSNTPCPASQIFEADSEKEFDDKVAYLNESLRMKSGFRSILTPMFNYL